MVPQFLTLRNHIWVLIAAHTVLAQSLRSTLRPRPRSHSGKPPAMEFDNEKALNYVQAWVAEPDAGYPWPFERT